MRQRIYGKKIAINKCDDKSLHEVFLIAKKIAVTNNKSLSEMRGEDPDTLRYTMLIPAERTEEERRKLSIIGY